MHYTGSDEQFETWPVVKEPRNRHDSLFTSAARASSHIFHGFSVFSLFYTGNLRRYIFLVIFISDKYGHFCIPVVNTVNKVLLH